MAAELTLRLNDAREVSPGLWPRTIALSTRQGKRTLAVFITGVSVSVVDDRQSGVKVGV